MWKNDGADGENSQMQNQHQQSVQLSLMLIQEEANSLYEDLKNKHGKESEEHFLMSAMTGFIGLRLEPNFTN